MNQLPLSSDLNVITAEIKLLETGMAKSMTEHAWEIGKRLVVAKESVGHGNFGNWIESNFEFSWQYATQFMRYFNENPNFNSRLNLPSWKHVTEVMSLPESVDRADFISEPHIIPSTGESKQVEDMTVKELREVKKQLKQAQYLASQLEATNALQASKLADQKDSPETLQRIADLESEIERQGNKGMENVQLKLEMKRMQQGFDEKISKRDEQIHATRELFKSLRNIVSTVNMEHANAKMLYKTIASHRTAGEAVRDFIKHFEPIVQDIFETWKAALELDTGEEESEHDERTGGPEQRNVIELIGGEGRKD